MLVTASHVTLQPWNFLFTAQHRHSCARGASSFCILINRKIFLWQSWKLFLRKDFACIHFIWWGVTKWNHSNSLITSNSILLYDRSRWHIDRDVDLISLRVFPRVSFLWRAPVRVLFPFMSSAGASSRNLSKCLCTWFTSEILFRNFQKIKFPKCQNFEISNSGC